MIDNEEIRQRKGVSGDEVVTCDLCGRPISNRVKVPLNGKRAMAEPVEALSICASCLASLEQDEVPFEEGIGDAFQISRSDDR